MIDKCKKHYFKHLIYPYFNNCFGWFILFNNYILQFTFETRSSPDSIITPSTLHFCLLFRALSVIICSHVRVTQRVQNHDGEEVPSFFLTADLDLTDRNIPLLKKVPASFLPGIKHIPQLHQSLICNRHDTVTPVVAIVRDCSWTCFFSRRGTSV